MQYAGLFKEFNDEVPPFDSFPRCDIAEVSLALAHSSLEEVTHHNPCQTSVKLNWMQVKKLHFDML